MAHSTVPPPGQLLQMLTDSQSAMARLFQSRASHLRLTRPQWRVLAGLHGHNGLTQTALSERTAIARSPLGKIVDQLERLGYVERRSDPDDRRINRLHLTSAVTPLIEPATRLVLELEEQVLSSVSDPKALLATLAELTTGLAELLEHEAIDAQRLESRQQVQH